jgi:uncharacterized membrane protein
MPPNVFVIFNDYLHWLGASRTDLTFYISNHVSIVIQILEIYFLKYDMVPCTIYHKKITKILEDTYLVCLY